MGPGEVALGRWKHPWGACPAGPGWLGEERPVAILPDQGPRPCLWPLGLCRLLLLGSQRPFQKEGKGTNGPGGLLCASLALWTQPHNTSWRLSEMGGVLWKPQFTNRQPRLREVKVTELGSGRTRIQTQACLIYKASMNHEIPTPNLILRSLPTSYGDVCVPGAVLDSGGLTPP